MNSTKSPSNIQETSDSQINSLAVFYLDSSKYLVFSLSAISFFYFHNIPTTLFLFGTVGNYKLGKFLKKLFPQPRPHAISKLKIDTGMPSGTSQSLAFFCTYITLILISLIKATKTSISFDLSLFELFATEILQYYIMLILIYLYVFSNLIIRWITEYHTFLQMLVGVIIGSIGGALWWTLITFFLNPYFQVIF